MSTKETKLEPANTSPAVVNARGKSRIWYLAYRLFILATRLVRLVDFLWQFFG